MQRQLGQGQGSLGPPAAAAQLGQLLQRPVLSSRQKHSRLLQRPQLKQAPWQEQDSIPLLSLSSLHPDLQQLVKRRQQQPLQPEALLPHPLCELNPAALTRRIKHCSSWHDAAVLFAQQAPCLNPIHLSALLVKLAHLPGPPSTRPVNWQPFVRQLLATSQPLLQCAEPRQLANMAWALAKLGVQDGVSECLLLPTANLSTGLSAGLSTNSMQQDGHGTLSHPAPLHSTSSWGPSSSTGGSEGEEVSCSPRSWAMEWQQQVLSRLHGANCRDVSNIMWALATSTRSRLAAAAVGQQQSSWHPQQQPQQQWGQQQQQQWGPQQQWQQPPLPQQSAGRLSHSRFVQELVSALHRTLPSSGPQDVANAMWALAVLQVRPSSELLSFLLIRLQSHFGDLKPREVATTLWGLSQLQAVPPSSWLQECLLRQVGREQWQHTQPRHWVMCLTACAHLKQVPPTAWLNECLAVLKTHMPQQTTSQDLQQQVEGQHEQQPGQQQLSQQQKQEEQLPHQQQQDPLLCQANSSSGYEPNSSSSSSSSSSGYQPNSSSSSSSSEASSSARMVPAKFLSTQDFANTVWALATLRVKPNADWMPGFVAYSAANLAAASPQELTNCMWGLQVLRVMPSEAWLAAFDTASLHHMGGFTPQGLADILAAQVRLGLRPSPAWCEAWITAVKASWGTADAPAVCKTLWAAAKCQLPLGRAWLGEALQQVHEPLLLPALAAGTLTVEELLRLVWAVGRLCQGLLSQELSNLLGLYCCRAAGKMTGVQLGRGAWGMARLVPLPRDGLLSHFHDLAASKVKYLPEREGQVLEQKLALLRDAAAKAELLGTNWRVILQHQAQQQHVVAQEAEPWTLVLREAIEQPTRSLVA